MDLILETGSRKCSISSSGKEAVGGNNRPGLITKKFLTTFSTTAQKLRLRKKRFVRKKGFGSKPKNEPVESRSSEEKLKYGSHRMTIKFLAYLRTFDKVKIKKKRKETVISNSCKKVSGIAKQDVSLS